jgi:hypothetical protein
VRKDVGQLLSWTHTDGQTGLVHALTVIARLLQSQDESGGLVIGDLIIHLFRQAGESVLPVLPDLLRAMLVRMQTAGTATFLQSLIVPFAFLVYNHCTAVLELLESTRVSEDGRLGLDVLLNAWCENAATFQGFWPTRMSALALCTLLRAERPSLQTVIVKGDIIITAATKNSKSYFLSFECQRVCLTIPAAIMTRSKTRVGEWITEGLEDVALIIRVGKNPLSLLEYPSRSRHSSCFYMSCRRMERFQPWQPQQHLSALNLMMK